MSARAQTLRNIIEFERRILELEYSIQQMVERWEHLNATEELDEEDTKLFQEYLCVKRERYVQCLKRIADDMSLRLV